MSSLALILIITIVAIGFYVIFQSKKHQKNSQYQLNLILSEMNEIREQINKINQTVYGIKSEHDGELWGGYDGKLGTRGKTEFLDEKLDSLIEVLNDKFMNFGKILDKHEMIYGESLYWEVMNNKLKKSKESTSSSKSSST